MQRLGLGIYINLWGAVRATPPPFTPLSHPSQRRLTSPRRLKTFGHRSHTLSHNLRTHATHKRTQMLSHTGTGVLLTHTLTPDFHPEKRYRRNARNAERFSSRRCCCTRGGGQDAGGSSGDAQISARGALVLDTRRGGGTNRPRQNNISRAHNEQRIQRAEHKGARLLLLRPEENEGGKMARRRRSSCVSAMSTRAALRAPSLVGGCAHRGARSRGTAATSRCAPVGQQPIGPSGAVRRLLVPMGATGSRESAAARCRTCRRPRGAHRAS